MPLDNDTEETPDTRFENDLGEIMRRTGGTFVADGRGLLTAGALRGRRKAARRCATVLTGGVLTLAALGTAGVYVTGGSGEDSASVADATPTRTHSSVPRDGASRTPASPAEAARRRTPRPSCGRTPTR